MNHNANSRHIGFGILASICSCALRNRPGSFARHLISHMSGGAMPMAGGSSPLPTTLQTLLISTTSHRSWADSVNHTDRFRVNFNSLHHGTDDLPACVPIRVLHTAADLVNQLLQPAHHK